MLEQFLPNIKDPADYITALSLFKVDAPLTAEDTEKLLELYRKYLPEVDDPEYLKICLAADLLPGRELDSPDFAPLELGRDNLAALFTAKGIVSGATEMNEQQAAAIVVQVKDEAAALPVRILLARVALDSMTVARNVAALREPISELAAFLTNCDTDVLDRYTVLVGEVRLKCR